MTYNPNDPNRPFEYPSLEGYPGPSADPYPAVDYPSTYPSGASPGYPAFPPPYQAPYQGYGANPYDPYGAPRPPGTNGMAIGALVTSCLGLTLCFCFVPSLVGIVLGILAMNETKRTGQGGRGMAVAAVVVGAVGIVFGIGIYVIGALAPDDTSTY